MDNRNIYDKNGPRELSIVTFG